MLNQMSLKQMFSQRHDSADSSAAGALSQAEGSSLQADGSPYDVMLVVIAFALFAIGFVIVTSASIPIATRLHDNPFYFSIRHSIYIGLSLTVAMIVVNIPMQFWRKTNPWLLLLAVLLLIAVLLIGNSVNGSKRWISVGPITIQAAEPAKLFFFCYLAGYLVRRKNEVAEQFQGFFKPLLVFFVLALLLLIQPDLGTVVVMFVTTIALLFLAGAKLWQFFAMFFTGLAAVVVLIVMSEYRMRRITAFLDPWADPFGSGYQLTQSLMAFGRGSWFGQGLGNSVQKLEFLPEAHTDFIAAILAEELGFIGVIFVLTLILMMVIKALKIGHAAMLQEKSYDAFLAFAIGIWFSFQTAINIGASSGVLPTKGLTLPLVSYGGSSLIVMSIAVAILIRIDFELRVDGVQAIKKSAKKVKRKVKSADSTGTGK